MSSGMAFWAAAHVLFVSAVNTGSVVVFSVFLRKVSFLGELAELPPPAAQPERMRAAAARTARDAASRRGRPGFAVDTISSLKSVAPLLRRFKM
jgi:hypothetical protein